jgi:membrane protein
MGVVVQLKDALNTVWEVEQVPGHGTWRFIRSYVVSLAAVLALGFLLLISLIVTTGLAAFSKYAAPHLAEWLLHLISSLISLAVIALLFAMMFKWLPDAAIDWHDVWLGAVLTAILFEIGKSANRQSPFTSENKVGSLPTVLRHPSSSCSSGSITRLKSS